MKKLCVLVFAVLTFTHCAFTREQINRNSYLATGRAPSGWTPKESLCPAFKRNGWQNHPPGPTCFKPPAKVATKKDAEWCTALFRADARQVAECVNDLAK